MKYLLFPIILLAVSCNEKKQASDSEPKHKTEEEHWEASKESLRKTAEEAKKTSKY